MFRQLIRQRAIKLTMGLRRLGGLDSFRIQFLWFSLGIFEVFMRERIARLIL